MNKVDNFIPLCVDLFAEGTNIDKHDVLYTSMAFHHIVDSDAAICVFNKFLNKGGYLCIADLVKEDGSFHQQAPDFDGHNGFDKDEVIELFEQHGFINTFYNEVYVIEKVWEDKIRKYPVFLMIGKKVD